jgi:O-antigen ligase
MILRLPRNFLFPLTTLAFVGITVQYVNIIFTPTTRWIFLLALMLYLLVKRRFMFGFQSLFGVALLSYCAWCMSTYSWSEVPQLSLEKAVAFSLVAVAFVSAGHDWIHDRGSLKALACLAPVTVIALFAGVMARGGGGAIVTPQRGVELYQGITDNPNMLGSLIAMALPLLLWVAYKNRARPQVRWVWFALLALAVLLLAKTYSRSAILAAGMVAMGFCWSLKLGRTGFVLALIAGAMLIATAASTEFFDTIYQDYILKGATEDYILQYSQGASEGGVLYTRQQVWQQSYENAQQGGWVGAGYGVTVGDTAFQGGATAVGYGREKGNTQLAIVEETGLVGLALYSFLLLTIFHPLVSAFRHENNSDRKVLLGIITGALAGFIVMSVFEAWWVSPGSAESAYFWSLAGVGLGLAQSSTYASKTSSPSPMAQGQDLYPARFPPQRRVKG